MTSPDESARSPFEQLLAAFTAGSGQPGGTPDLGALFGQLQQLFAPHEGSINWSLARDLARRAVAQDSDPAPSAADQRAVADAVRLAELWLDAACGLPAGASLAEAWSRAEWVEATMPVWQRLVEPVAAQVVDAMRGALPTEAQPMAAPLLGMLGQAGGAMFGAQIGQAVGGLATEVIHGAEIGLPLGPAGRAAIVTTNAREFGSGLGVAAADVLLYVALRECAYQRLFAHVSWLPSQLFGAVEDYARGIAIDTSAIENAMTSFDPGNLEALQEAVGGGLFEPKQTPGQSAALQRLETMLALVDGWVDEVVGQATAERMPTATALHEAVRRRRAAGGPAEQTFASLVGLELRPRRLRDAVALWGAYRSAHGQGARDDIWAHPDRLPGSADLDDPLGFAERGGPAASSPEGANFDAALAELMDRELAPEEETDAHDERDDAPDNAQDDGTQS